ncbi:hypothetical protein CLV24_104185 [Pontibacter ummariensis]|uniref:Uncharacterized protein n=1 Tax=Pontibacter ummariensis TaxID=1610492 RepID=A0A239DDR0_9BACT|nr:hypothetical protein [Pontibacter ummariensis]PRY14375.1 hypothetical protein CLV24_104185 [Pontibacter ummariensis]SNS30479.1 hypothetical protein SAMN06296052_104184 [Pontibacter ummariensis]
MPQGTVIAVKPLGYASENTLLYARSLNASGAEGSGPDTGQGNLVYIKVFEEKEKLGFGRKSDTVVWYEDTEGRLVEGDHVHFEINKDRTKPIQGAQNVRRLQGGRFYIPGDLLSKVALLSSLLLLVALVLDRQR